MTDTNHVMTGAVIALAVQQPAVAIPMALVSHFALDIIPHFGIYEDDVIRRNKTWQFRAVVFTDVPLMVAACLIIPRLVGSVVPAWTVFACMVAAVIPDIVWLFRFIREERTKRPQPSIWLTRAHQAIQWFEHPIGISVELAWLATVSFFFVKLLP